MKEKREVRVLLELRDYWELRKYVVAERSTMQGLLEGIVKDYIRKKSIKEKKKNGDERENTGA